MEEDQIELKNDIDAEHGFVRSKNLVSLTCIVFLNFSHLQMTEVSALNWFLLTMSISVITMVQLRC